MKSVFGVVGVFHHPTYAPARELAARVCDRLRPSVARVWMAGAWDPAATDNLPGTDLLICIGGDGTVLRGARVVVPHPIPILGVDMGRFAFLTEFTAGELLAHLDEVLAGRMRVEERAMLDAHLEGFPAETRAPAHSHALNDVIVGRTALGRPVYLDVSVNGDLVGVLRADAVVVATATGSTAYALSAGGPILDPLARSLVVAPVAPHLAAAAPLVLPEDAVIDLAVHGDGNVAVSIDGQGQFHMDAAGRVHVQRSPHVTRLLRYWDKPFFAQLGRRLAWLDERRLEAVGRQAALEPPLADSADAL